MAWKKEWDQPGQVGNIDAMRNLLERLKKLAKQQGDPTLDDLDIEHATKFKVIIEGEEKKKILPAPKRFKTADDEGPLCGKCEGLRTFNNKTCDVCGGTGRANVVEGKWSGPRLDRPPRKRVKR